MLKREHIIKKLEAEGINPYSYYFKKNSNSEILKEKYKKLKSNKKTKDKVKIAGRIMIVRDLGKLNFISIQDEKGRIQIVIQKGETPEKVINLFKKCVKEGDIIGVSGIVFRTKKGELSVLVKDFEILTKSLLQLPGKWYGLKNIEERYRKRYLDLIMNPEVKGVFLTREKIINTMREFMKKKDYVEVQTPILQPIYGGGSARPFVSKLNALNMRIYMRIANELYLKRLVVGGFEKVFEFSIDFRNESIDRSHNPEFLLFEAMTAYTDYKDGMKLVEDIMEDAVKKVKGDTKVIYQGKKIDFKKPWKRISVREAIKKYAKIDIEKTSNNQFKKILKKHKIELEGGYNKGNAIMALIDEFCEKHFIQPTILYDYPIETSSLAKKKRDDPKYAERFEHYINGWELGNNYSELNDPEVLTENWKKQEEMLKKGDEEAQRMDKDFINALEYGMPPTCGIGISIDRFVMILTDSRSIRDVIFFPFMKQIK